MQFVDQPNIEKSPWNWQTEWARSSDRRDQGPFSENLLDHAYCHDLALFHQTPFGLALFHDSP
jgi:hypothetical protein